MSISFVDLLLWMSLRYATRIKMREFDMDNSHPCDRRRTLDKGLIKQIAINSGR